MPTAAILANIVMVVGITIDGAGTLVLSSQHQAAMLVSDGADWWLIQSGDP